MGGNPLSFADPNGLFLQGLLLPLVEGIAAAAEAAAARAVASAAGAAIGGAAADALKDRCPNDDCAALLAAIEREMAVVKRRYWDLVYDRQDLFNTRHSGTRSWLGHIQQFQQAQQRLRTANFNALEKGCPVPGEAWYWASMQPPSAPFLRRP